MKFILVADEDIEISSFFPLWQVGIFVVFVTIILVLLKPRDLLQETLNYHEPAAVVLSYLKCYAHANKNQNVLLYPLVAQEIGMGQIKDAKANIAYLKAHELPNSSTQAMLDYLDYLLVRYQVYKSKLNSPERIEYLKKMVAMGNALTKAPIGTVQLQALAWDFLGIGEAGAALKIYQDLMARGMLTTPEELANGANIAMQNNAHQISSQFYWAAYEKANQVREKRKYATEAINALWAGNYVTEALSLVQQLPFGVVHDKNMLLLLSRLALAANKPELAEQYVLEAITIVPKRRYEKRAL